MTKSTSKLFQSEEPKEMKEDAMNLPEETTEKEEVEQVNEVLAQEKIPEEQTEVIDTPPASPDDIQDIDLSAIKKKRFRINGDSNKILELNTSDLSISSRLSAAYERLTKCMDEVAGVLADVPDDAEELTEAQEKAVEEQLRSIDAKMRKELDYIFDAPVSDVCADGGSMYDPFEGQFRFEHIIDALSRLYETNLNREFGMMKRRVNTKTSKYTKKYHN